MDKLNVWSKQIIIDLNQKKEELYKRDYKFFKIDRLERIAERVDEFSDSCEECYKLKPEIEDITDRLTEYVNGSPRKRAEYEKRSEAILKHLKKKHKLSQKSYYSSVYTAIGLAAGLLISIGLSYALVPGLEWTKIGRMLFDGSSSLPGSDMVRYSFLGGFLPPVIIGRIYGASVDKKIQKEKRLL